MASEEIWEAWSCSQGINVLAEARRFLHLEQLPGPASECVRLRFLSHVATNHLLGSWSVMSLFHYGLNGWASHAGALSTQSGKRVSRGLFPRNVLPYHL